MWKRYKDLSSNDNGIVYFYVIVIIVASDFSK